jgi:hypothetical protein
MLLRSSPTSFRIPSPSLASPRSGSSAPLCPLVGKQGQMAGLRLTPSATRRNVEVMANSAPAAAGAPLSATGDPKSLRLLFVEMGTGYDQHGYVSRVLLLLLVSFGSWAFVESRSGVHHRSARFLGCTFACTPISGTRVSFRSSGPFLCADA